MPTDLQTLLRYATLPDLTPELEDQRLTQIGRDVVRWTTIDDASRADWLERSQRAMDLALQVVEPKTFPWEGAAAIKYPLITVAALQFHARAYPAVVQGNKVVKGQVTGRDPQGQKAAQAERISQFMNYQLLEEMEEWDEQTDRLLLALPVEGCEFKKTFFDPALGRPVSEWIRPLDLIVHYRTKSLETCPRVTHRLWLHPQEIMERQLSGTWRDVGLNIGVTETEEEELQEFYEQHCLLDLDGDGYKEPYCVTVHKTSETVVRVKASYYPEGIWTRVGSDVLRLTEVPSETPIESVRIARIERSQYFTKFSFVPSPDGGFYDLGFGQLVGPLCETIDTSINQMIDAGTLGNLSGGFIREGVTIDGKRGSIRFELGEFKQVRTPQGMPLRDALYQMQFPGPSPVLFNLLSLLIQGAKDITGVQDILTGGPAQNETATTTMAKLEQGLKVFSAIYKRVYRGLKGEFKKLYRINGLYLQPEVYFRVLDDGSEGVVSLSDFQNDGTDVQPVADPSVSTTLQKVVKAEMVMALKGDPGINPDEANRRYLEAIEVPGADALIVSPEQRQPPPDPKMLDMELKMIQLKDQARKMQAEIELMRARSIEALASAEAKEAGAQLDHYALQLDVLKEVRNDGARGVEGVEAAPSNQGGAEAGQGVPAAMPSGFGGGDQPGLFIAPAGVPAGVPQG